MKYILNIKVPIPFELLKGVGEISQKRPMNEIQKRFAALFATYKELDIAALTLPEAIEKTLGIKTFNQKFIEDDIKEFLVLTCPNAKYNKKDLFGILAINFNSDVRNEILNKQAYFMPSHKSRLTKVSILQSQFNDIKDVKDEGDLISFNEDDSPQFTPTLKFTKIQKEDVISGIIHSKIDPTRTIVKSEKLEEEGQIVWKPHNIEIQIDDLEIKTNDPKSKYILDLVENKFLSIDIQSKINKKIDELGLKKLDSDIQDISVLSKIEGKFLKYSFLDNHFIINENIVYIYGYKEVTKRFINKNISIKVLTMQQKLLEDFIKKYGSHFSIDFINSQSSKTKQIILSNLLQKNIRSSSIDYPEIAEEVNIELIRTLPNSSLEKMYKNKLFEAILMRNLASSFNLEDIIKYYEISNIKEEDIIKKFNLQYKSSPIFPEWDSEKKMFAIIDQLNNFNASSKTKDELKEILENHFSQVKDILKEQNIFTAAIKNFETLINKASAWNEAQIYGEAIKIRSFLENEVKKIAHNNSDGVRKILKENIISKKAEQLSKVWNLLSSKYAHNEKLYNLAIAEKEVKKVISDVKSLIPFEEKDFIIKKKKEKNVT